MVNLFQIDVEEMEKVLLNHCNKMSILKLNAGRKKVDAILDNLIASIVRTKLTLEEVQECIKDVNQDKVINLNIFEKGGNLFTDYIDPKWVKFARALFRQRSTGLGTPNAASGEGELMFLFLSKHIKKPTSGDLKIKGKIIELKGEGTRVMGKISGKQFAKKTLRLCPEFGLNPNKSNVKTQQIEAVEIEKTQHLNHWKGELSRLSLKKQKEFIGKWLSCLDEKNHKESVKKIFNGSSFNQNQLIKEIIKILYASMVNSNNFSKFVILGDGENVKIFSRNIKDFKKRVDNGEILEDGDYFRINQDANIGWYIK